MARVEAAIVVANEEPEAKDHEEMSDLPRLPESMSEAEPVEDTETESEPEPRRQRWRRRRVKVKLVS